MICYLEVSIKVRLGFAILRCLEVLVVFVISRCLEVRTGFVIWRCLEVRLGFDTCELSRGLRRIYDFLVGGVARRSSARCVFCKRDGATNTFDSSLRCQKKSTSPRRTCFPSIHLAFANFYGWARDRGGGRNPTKENEKGEEVLEVETLKKPACRVIPLHSKTEF